MLYFNIHRNQIALTDVQLHELSFDALTLLWGKVLRHFHISNDSLHLIYQAYN